MIALLAPSSPSVCCRRHVPHGLLRVRGRAFGSAEPVGGAPHVSSCPPSVAWDQSGRCEVDRQTAAAPAGFVSNLHSGLCYWHLHTPRSRYGSVVVTVKIKMLVFKMKGKEAAGQSGWVGKIDEHKGRKILEEILNCDGKSLEGSSSSRIITKHSARDAVKFIRPWHIYVFERFIPSPVVKQLRISVRIHSVILLLFAYVKYKSIYSFPSTSQIWISLSFYVTACCCNIFDFACFFNYVK